MTLAEELHSIVRDVDLESNEAIQIQRSHQKIKIVENY